MEDAGTPAYTIKNMPDGISITLAGRVDEIWDNDITWISQKGVLSDSTGKTCFRIFKHSNLPDLELNKKYTISNAISHIWDGWSSIDLDEHTTIKEIISINDNRTGKSVGSSFDGIISAIDVNKGFYYIVYGNAEKVIIKEDAEKTYSDNVFLIIKPNGYIAVTRVSKHDYKSIVNTDHLSFLKIKDGYYFIVNSIDGDSISIVFNQIYAIQYRYEPDFPLMEKSAMDDYFNEIKIRYPNFKKRWSTDETELLIECYKENNNVFFLADRFQKEPSAIVAKLVLLNIKNDFLVGDSHSLVDNPITEQEITVPIPYTREIIILANSIKHKARCIAGKDIKTGEWVRFVTDNEGKAFTSNDLLNLYNNKNGPRLLDTIVVTFSYKIPLNYHPEDEFIEIGKAWVKTGSFNRNDIDKMLDNNDWVSQLSILFHDTDKVPSSYFKKNKLKNSLQLIKLNDKNKPILKYRHKPIKNNFHPRLCFNYKGLQYDLSITDPNCGIKNVDPGPRALDNCYITVGLSEEYDDNNHYKLIVGLIF